MCVCVCVCVRGDCIPFPKERAVFTSSDTVVLILGFTLESPDKLPKHTHVRPYPDQANSILGEWLVLRVFEELPG